MPIVEVLIGHMAVGSIVIELSAAFAPSMHVVAVVTVSDLLLVLSGWDFLDRSWLEEQVGLAT